MDALTNIKMKRFLLPKATLAEYNLTSLNKALFSSHSHGTQEHKSQSRSVMKDVLLLNVSFNNSPEGSDESTSAHLEELKFYHTMAQTSNLNLLN